MFFFEGTFARKLDLLLVIVLRFSAKSLLLGEHCLKFIVELAMFSLGLVWTKKYFLPYLTGFKKAADLLFTRFFMTLGPPLVDSFFSVTSSSSSYSEDKLTESSVTQDTSESPSTMTGGTSSSSFSSWFISRTSLREKYFILCAEIRTDGTAGKVEGASWLKLIAERAVLRFCQEFLPSTISEGWV